MGASDPRLAALREGPALTAYVPRLLPAWAATVAGYSPFPSTFGYPIDVLAGDLSTRELFTGLLQQGIWIAVGAGLVAVVWRSGVKRFSSVGG